jgi:NAD(P)-dependent dehydrogenase (short-subunit alcohol dehydrogenase family)
MAGELRFDGRVAVITGGGRGLGRAYALLLAARGAKIVVNDPGVGLRGDGIDEDPAADVVEEIRSAGGQAVADRNSVATPEGGQAIIQTALDNFGRIDILIHNAGIVRRAALKEMPFEVFESVLDVHLRGGFHVVRAAFPLMCAQQYGRIVLTSSISGIYGNANVVNYAVAKTGLLGLSNVAAIEGGDFGVKCNSILPAAVTRMAEGLDTSTYPPMDPDLVAPAVAWLSHESCSVTGEMFASIAGRIAKVYVAEAQGVYRPDWTIEDVAANIDAIRDTADPVIFAPAPTGHVDHLRYSFAMAKNNK